MCQSEVRAIEEKNYNLRLEIAKVKVKVSIPRVRSWFASCVLGLTLITRPQYQIAF